MEPQAGSPELLAAVRAALMRSAARFAELLRKVPDRSAPAIGVWSVGETAAHVASSGPAFLAVARGTRRPEGLDAVAAGNEAALGADPERDPAVLADRVEAGEAALAAFLAEAAGDPEVEAFAGVRVPLSSLAAVELGELLVHGHDIARACGLPWPIPREDAAPAATGVLPILPHLVDPRKAAGMRARYEVRIRGGGTAILAFDAGAARIEAPSSRRVDCHISMDPAAYLLLGFNRTGILRPLLGGNVLAWGRRPWLAAAFPSLFVAV